MVGNVQINFGVIWHFVLTFSNRKINSTSAINVRFSGKYRSIDKLKLQTIHKLNTTHKKQTHNIQQNKTTMVQSLLTTLSQGKRWAYFTMIPSPLFVLIFILCMSSLPTSTNINNNIVKLIN